MSDTDSGGNGESGGNGAGETGSNGSGPAAAAMAAAPEIRMIAQYVKDSSFESPKVPQALPFALTQPEVNVSVSVNARALNTDHTEFEVELGLQGKGTKDGETYFIVELLYAARMSAQNVPDEMKAPLTLIEAPRILFPFARRIIADMVRDGGFQPLMIEPIDFGQLYKQRMEQLQAEQAKSGATETA